MSKPASYFSSKLLDHIRRIHAHQEFVLDDEDNGTLSRRMGHAVTFVRANRRTTHIVPFPKALSRPPGHGPAAHGHEIGGQRGLPAKAEGMLKVPQVAPKARPRRLMREHRKRSRGVPRLA